MELTDWIRTGSLVIVFFIVAVFSERSVWITSDILASVGFGLGFLIFPTVMLDFQVTDTLDSLHLFLSRLFGIMLLCSALVSFFTRDTRDGTVTITLMMSRVFTGSIILISQAFTLWGTPHGANYWTEQFLWFGMVGTLLWVLGHLIHLFRSGDFSTYPQHNIRLNNHLRVDSWLVFLTATALIAFPDFLIRHLFGKPGNLIHLHLVRCMAALGFGDAVVSMHAPGFLHERDKRAQLCARLLWVLCLCVPWLVASLLLKMTSLEALSHLILVYLAPLSNAFVGFFTEGNVIYRVPHKKD